MWTVHIAFALSALEGALFVWLGRRARGTGVHVFGRLSGLLRGRSVTARHLVAGGAAVIAAALAGLVLTLVADARARDAFRFQIPAGWIDVSPGAPADGLERAGPLAALGREPGVAAAAVLVDGRMAASFRAKVLAGGWTPVFASLREQAERDARALSEPAAPAEITAIDLVTVRDVPAGRYEISVTVPGHETKERVYVLPGTATHAYIVYASADSAFFWAHEPEVAAAAEATEGIAVPPRFLRPVYLTLGTLLLVAVSFFAFGQRPRRPSLDLDLDDDLDRALDHDAAAASGDAPGDDAADGDEAADGAHDAAAASGDAPGDDAAEADEAAEAAHDVASAPGPGADDDAR